MDKSKKVTNNIKMSTIGENRPPEKLYKIIVIGDVSVGKTSIIRKYTTGEFTNMYKSTIGVDFAVKSFMHNNQKISVQLWDIAGSERYKNLTRVYYKDAIAALIVADISNPKSYTAATLWKKDCDDKIEFRNGPLPSFLIINKCDLKKNNNQNNETSDQINEISSIIKETNKNKNHPVDLESFIIEHNFDGFYEVSAKTDSIDVINKIFADITDFIIKIENERTPYKPISQPTIAITTSPIDNPSKCC